MPKTKKEGNFSISFPIDIHYFSEVIDAIQKETGAGGGAYNLKVKADVHTVAKTDLSTVDEVYSQTLEGKLEGGTLTFGKELSQSQSGSIGGTKVASSSRRDSLKVPAFAGLIVALMALGFLSRNQARLKPAGINAVEVEAARARKKYKQVMVDIEELPEVKPNETVITVGSLDDLVRIADDLVKPVLHRGEERRHIYCTVDGLVRYQYVNRAEDSAESKTAS